MIAEMIWKLIERVLDQRISKTELHGYLYGFCSKRGYSTGIMEAKLVQQLTFREQCQLYGIFLDLKRLMTQQTGTDA